MNNNDLYLQCGIILNEVRKGLADMSDKEINDTYRVIFSCIDNTTLNGSDSEQSVKEFCRKTREYTIGEQSLHVASVCVYPSMVEHAKRALEQSGIKVASVAGAFPSGQLPQQLKCNEVVYAVESGADEIDYVINRGDMLSGNDNRVFDEISAARRACGPSVLLKVILETGELKEPDLIYRASTIAMEAGADFVKTSTGKIDVGATPDAACYMLSAVADFYEKTKKEVGFKAAGGISTVEEALMYYLLTKKILNKKNLSNHIFRIGTSRITPQLFNFLTV